MIGKFLCFLGFHKVEHFVIAHKSGYLFGHLVNYDVFQCRCDRCGKCWQEIDEGQYDK